MRPVLALLALTTLLLPCRALTANAPKPTPVEKNPEWVRKPTPEDMALYYPPLAQAAHAGGRVTLKCQVDANGFARDCVVLDETPLGLGFGKAAQNLSILFRMSPKTVDGTAVSGAEVNIPVRFDPTAIPMVVGQLSTPLIFVTRPGVADLERVRTPEMKNGSAVALSCGLTTSGPATGHPRYCVVITEMPKDAGAGKAALSLVPLFLVDAAATAHTLPTTKVDILLLWP